MAKGLGIREWWALTPIPWGWRWGMTRRPSYCLLPQTGCPHRQGHSCAPSRRENAPVSVLGDEVLLNNESLPSFSRRAPWIIVGCSLSLPCLRYSDGVHEGPLLSWGFPALAPLAPFVTRLSGVPRDVVSTLVSTRQCQWLCAPSVTTNSVSRRCHSPHVGETAPREESLL